MSRLPFDPSFARGPEEPEGPPRPARRERGRGRSLTEAEFLTVSELTDLIRTTLEQRIASPLRVVGQVSNLSAQNHWYFSLKDEAAVVRCVAWASTARRFGFTPQDGDEVVATGHVSHYPPQGRTQFYVSQLRPLGAGALQLRFQAMCEELRRLGYFDERRKRPLPGFPRRVAVITSAGGAAVHDVISTAAQRCRAVGLLVVDARVQGEGAAEDVARAIRWVDAHRERLGVDAVLVTRGGGSMEDLWAFNERIVADAVLESSLPLVAAIGHESDTTVIELVADVRAATPTQAAVRLVPSAEELRKQVGHLAHRLDVLIARQIERGRQRLGELAGRELFRDPRAIVGRARGRLDDRQRDLRRVVHGRLSAARVAVERLAGSLSRLRPHRVLAERRERLAVLAHRLARAAATRIEQRPRLESMRQRLVGGMAIRLRRCRDRLVHLERQMSAVDPRHVLRRGFSYTTRPDGLVVRSVDDVREGGRIVTHLADGSLESVIDRREARESPPPRERSPSADQMDLFRAPE